MPLEQIYLGLFTAVLGGGLGALFWARLNRIEARLEQLTLQVAGTATREELAKLRNQVAGIAASAATRQEVAELRKDLSDRMGGLATRAEVVAMRADLTQIALALGASRPRAEEG